MLFFAHECTGEPVPIFNKLVVLQPADQWNLASAVGDGGTLGKLGTSM